MKRLVLVSSISLLLFSAGTASAQYGPRPRPNYGPGYQPGISPYLNLLRNGDPAINYYLGTVPEFQRRANASFFRSALIDLDQRATGGAQTDEERLAIPLAGSGHPTAFGNTSTYFGSSNPYVGAAQRAAGQATPGQTRPRR